MSEIPDPDPEVGATPQRAAALAATAARAIRALSIATRGGVASPCIGWPISPREIPANLAAAVPDTAQVCRQFADQLQAHHAAGTFEPDPGAAGQIAIGVEDLNDAAGSPSTFATCSTARKGPSPASVRAIPIRTAMTNPTTRRRPRA